MDDNYKNKVIMFHDMLCTKSHLDGECELYAEVMTADGIGETFEEWQEKYRTFVLECEEKNTNPTELLRGLVKVVRTANTLLEEDIMAEEFKKALIFFINSI